MHPGPVFAAVAAFVSLACPGAPQAAPAFPPSVHPELWPAAAAAAADPATEAFVRQLLAHMSLEDKVGQMIQADIASISPAELRTYKLGSILAGGNAAPGDNVRATATVGANVQSMPVAATSCAVASPIRRTKSGSCAAPRATLCGKMVAPTTFACPCTASMPNRIGIGGWAAPVAASEAR